jgi:agmatinase
MSDNTSNNFLGLEPEFSDLESSRFVVLPIPYDATASYLKGTVNGPQAIISASQQVEFFDEILLDEFYQAGVYTAAPVQCENVGPEELQERISAAAAPYVNAYKFLLSLGGEHSVTPALVKTVRQRYDNLSVLHIDAHADLRDEYHGSIFSHACAMRRIYDMNIPVVHVGIRSFDKDQHDFILAHKVKMFSPVAIAHKPDWIKDVLRGLTDNVYISLDIDGLDPAYAPGTGTPEPGGLNYQQLVDLFIAVGKTRHIVGADIVEVIPNLPGVVTEFLAARLAYKIIAAAQLLDQQ